MTTALLSTELSAGRGAPRARSTAPPRRVGERFDVLDELGRGSMGVVYLAHDTVNAERVAIKLSLRRGERATARAAREALATGRLEHPNVARLVTSGLDAGRPWLAFELVPGARTLTAASVGAPRARRLRWLVDAARGLAHAHQRGVVHRDVKPDNVLVGADGRARIIDFGLASLGDEARAPLGRLVGTPRVMAPEQVRGRPVTPATDVWGLGGLLYHALLDRFPFEHDEKDALCRAILLGRPVPPRRLDRSVPRALDLLVLDALARDPGRRPPDAGAFVGRLERWVDGGPGAWLERARACFRR